MNCQGKKWEMEKGAVNGRKRTRSEEQKGKAGGGQNGVKHWTDHKRKRVPSVSEKKKNSDHCKKQQGEKPRT